MLESVEMPGPSAPLELRVRQRIHERTGGQVRRLQIAVAEGTAAITGQTRTYYLKQLALAAVLEIRKSESLAFTLNIDVD